MAVMSGGMRLLTALRGSTINCNAISTRLLFYRNSKSASSPAPPSPDKYVTAQLVLRADVPRARQIRAVPNALFPRILIIDGVCHLSLAGVKWVIEHDSDVKIRFCCLQSKTAEPYIKICGLTRDDVLRRILFVEGSDSYHYGSSAILRILSYLPPPYSAMSSLIMIIPSPLRNALYDYVAKNRYRWFGVDHDLVALKDSELIDRFIDRYEILEHHRFRRD